MLLNNRYLRLLPRLCVVIVLPTLCLHDFDTPVVPLGIITGTLYFLVLWEWIASMDKGLRFLEPKA